MGPTSHAASLADSEPDTSSTLIIVVVVEETVWGHKFVPILFELPDFRFALKFSAGTLSLCCSEQTPVSIH